MTVIPFVKSNTFGPEVIRAMDEAFISVCATLKISERAGGLTEQVAVKAVELASQGEHDTIRLTRRLLEVFNTP